MKNILFLHSSSELYGSDRSLLNLVKNLNKEEFNVTVILPEDGPLVEEIKKLQNIKILIKEIAVLRRKNLSPKGMICYTSDFFKSLKYLRNTIKENNIDIVYTNTSVVFPGGIAAKTLRKKSIWHIREIISNKYERFVVSKIVNLFSDVIIANSKATGQSISKNEKKVKVVYNAIEGSITNNINKEKDKKSDFVIGMAGRINRWKGQKLFVDMAKDVLQKRNDVRFLIAGDVYKGEVQILEDLKEHIKAKGIEKEIELLGQVSDMDNFYNKLDIFVLPSTQPEPFGLVVIEAMDREIPVVATNHGGPVEIIENNKTGFLVDYKNSTEMSQAVLRLLEDKDLREQVSKNGKEKRERVYTIKAYVENISQILNLI